MKKEGTWTEYSQLQFTLHQLQQLNVYFSDMEISHDLKQNQTSLWIEAEIEKLIQYLTFIIGRLDRRFTSEFLVRLEPSKAFAMGSNCFSYLIRLDNLSYPTSSQSNQDSSVNYHLQFDEDKARDGFAKIKFKEDYVLNKRWQEFTADGEYLRRDAIQQRYVELLKKIAALKTSNIDSFTKSAKTSVLPGKIIDAETLHHVLNIPVEERIFYGSAEEIKPFDLLDIKKYRIVVVESEHLIKLRIGFLSENVILDEDVDVILILGIGLQGWPPNSDYPHRIPLTNCDVLLHQQVATTGFFLMTATPPALSDDKDRSLLWQFFFPTVDCILTNHYADVSTFIRTINIVYIVMLNLRRTTCGGHTIGKFVIKTLTWLRQEKLNEPKLWTSEFLSYHIIAILDELVNCLRQKNCRSYIFESYNALTNSFRSALSPFSDRDCEEDADIVETFINRIHALSSSELIGHQMISEERRLHQSCSYEKLLMNKWSALLDNMVSSCTLQSKSFTFIPKQIEYIAALFRALLVTRSITLPAKKCQINNTHAANSENYSTYAPLRESTRNISVEDVCYVLSTLFEQAKEHFLQQKCAASGYSRASKNPAKLDEKSEAQYEETIKCALNKMRENPLRIIGSEFQATTSILQTFYETSTATAASKKTRKIIKPYLKLFFVNTHKNCWYLDEWKHRVHSDEFTALRIFLTLISQNKISCKAGLLDALKKNWEWASNMFKLCAKQKSGLELLCTSSEGKRIKHRLILSDEDMAVFKKFRLSNSRHEYKSTINELCASLRLEEKLEYLEDESCTYYQLRDGSPISQIISNSRRKGIHLGLGNIIFSLVTLGKFTLLQEITEILPEEKRHRALENIQVAAKIKQRHDRERKKLNYEEEMYKTLPDYPNCTPPKQNQLNDDTICKSASRTNNSSRSQHHSGITTLSKCSSFLGRTFFKRRTSITCNSTAYYDAPITYFQDNSTRMTNLRNPTSQPYLRLSSDKNFSLSRLTDAQNCSTYSNDERV